MLSENYLFWPDGPPGAPEVLPTPRFEGPAMVAYGVAQPSFFVLRPDKIAGVAPTGVGVVIFSGGGYNQIVLGEGAGWAQPLLKAGITCFLVVYRLPGDGWADRADVPLQDAQRVVRVIRAMAENFAIDPAMLGVLGFSAGGHMAATLATGFTESVYQSSGPVDEISARPAFAGLIYPVISMLPPAVHMDSCMHLFGPSGHREAYHARSPEWHVTPQTPPCFIAHAMDDGLVTFQNALVMASALGVRGIASALHVFPNGGHGFNGPAPPLLNPAALWPGLFINWLAELNWYDR